MMGVYKPKMQWHIKAQKWDEKYMKKKMQAILMQGARTFSPVIFLP